MLRAVLFDLDDTLMDQASAAGAAVEAWAAEHGIADADVRERWTSVSEANFVLYSRRELTFAQQRRQRVREFLAVQIDDQEADELFAGYLVRYEAGWATFDDAVPALRRARAAGLIVGVLTNGAEEQQRSKLQKLGLEDEIDHLIASSMLPAGKPDLRAFQHAVHQVGVDAREVLMVGDSLENDVRGALSAGLEATLLDRYDVHRDVDVPRVRSLDHLTYTSSLTA